MNAPTSATSFIGTSKRGNLTEALRNAIEQAKESLRTDLIIWEVKEALATGGVIHLIPNESLSPV
jgi:flavin-binding protein dodecin